MLPPAIAAALPATDMNVMLAALEQPADRFGAHAVEKRGRLLLTTLASAYGEMEKLQGPDPGSWQWGKLNQLLLEHPFSPVVPEARRTAINIGPIPLPGGEFTPNNSSRRPNESRPTAGPSFRVIVDVGNWDNSRAVNHPGQSGDPDSPHYRDLAPLWRDGRYFPLLYSRKAVTQATEKVIRLVPDKVTAAHPPSSHPLIPIIPSRRSR